MSTTISDRGSLAVQTLGEFQVHVDDVLVPDKRWESNNARWLLVYLLLQDRPVAQRSLAELFWPASPEDKAHRCLVSTVHRLRKALGRSYLVVRREASYGIAADATVSFDVQRFEKAFEQGRMALKEGDKEGALACFEQMQKLYRGAFLVDCDHVWSRDLSQRLSEALVLSISLGATCYLPESPETAERWCRRGLKVDRSAEALWWVLLQCRHLAGDRVGLGLVYREAYESIRQATGGSVSSLLRSLYERLVPRTPG